MKLVVALVIVTACGPGAQLDAGADPTGSGSGATSGLTCLTSVATDRRPDGTRTEMRTYFVIVSDVHPGDHFVIERCDYSYVTPCPTGDTCTTSGDAVPPGRRCDWTTDGTFIDTSLYVYCGLGETGYDAAGSATYTLEERYGTVKLHR